ncbi:HugZ family protein [Caenispirillum salinarum]|uniref:HugZ family pyridoxamine 5'-phosphate oxidase n=1 Tax=Caenispirillum salinarum TaxID=859058 RepID=UPI00384F3410
MRKDIPTIKPGRSHRDAVRRLLRGARRASLATTMAEGGAPYASLVTVATDQDGSPILLLSGLADHTRNLTAEPRAALLVDEAEGLDNPQTGPRATALGRIERLADPTREERARRRFLARHPAAAMYAGFGDFGFYRMTVERAHFVGGFARAVWIDDGPSLLTPPALAAAMGDAEISIITHMNDDHANAVDLYARRLCGRSGEGWRMAAIDADGCDLVAGEQAARLPFDPSLTDPSAARETLVALVKKARAGGAE